MSLPASSLEMGQVVGVASSTKIVLTVEYDGTRYCGFQWQAGVPTVQGEIEQALWRLSGERGRVMAASRTDSGVHAQGQVVSFRTNSALPLQTFVRGLNYYLAEDVAVKAAFRVNDSFNIRRSAVSREYRYYILNSIARSPMRRGFTHLVPGELDVEKMNQACQVLVGKHDFASFTVDEEVELKDTVRELYKAEVARVEDLVICRVVANSFLRHQVRNIAGSLIRVGLGRMTVDEFRDILAAKVAGLAGPRAPAGGLCLMKVNYPVPFGEMD